MPVRHIDGTSPDPSRRGKQAIVHGQVSQASISKPRWRRERTVVRLDIGHRHSIFLGCRGAARTGQARVVAVTIQSAFAAVTMPRGGSRQSENSQGRDSCQRAVVCAGEGRAQQRGVVLSAKDPQAVSRPSQYAGCGPSMRQMLRLAPDVRSVGSPWAFGRTLPLCHCTGWRNPRPTPITLVTFGLMAARATAAYVIRWVARCHHRRRGITRGRRNGQSTARPVPGTHNDWLGSIKLL